MGESMELQRHKLSVDDYYRMAQAGILHEDDRVELIAGEVLDMVPIGSRHAEVVDRISELFIRRLAGQWRVRVQGPLRLGRYDEPEPDVAVYRYADYSGAHPGPADAVLVVEVADSSLAYDRRVKLPLYARHRIPEVWVINLERGVIEVNRDPADDGYRQCLVVTRGEGVAPLLLPELRVPVVSILA